MAKKRASKKAEPETTGTWGQVLAIVALLSALVAIAIFLFQDREFDPRYSVDIENAIVLATEGQTDAASIRSSLLDCVAPIAENASLLGSELTARIKEALASSPWIRQVRGVRRVFPGGIELDLDIREPFVEFEIEGRYMLADKEGQILPEILDQARGLPYRLTLRPNGDPEAAIGSWDDAWLRDAVRQGVQLYLDLEKEPAPLRDLIGEAAIVAVDVSNHACRLDRRRAELSLVSARHYIETGTARPLPVVIRWGRSSRHHLYAIELATRRKLENLKDVIQQRNGAFEGIRELDLRLDEAVWTEH